jgi:hypothetical protein
MITNLLGDFCVSALGEFRFFLGFLGEFRILKTLHTCVLLCNQTRKSSP